MIITAYVSVSLTALACYVFLFCAFALKRDDKIVSALKLLLISMIGWTFGDLCMREQFQPGMRFWFAVSFTSETFVPVTFYYFILSFLGKNKKWFMALMTGITLVIDVLNVTLSAFVKLPETIRDDEGVVSYVYHAGAGFWVIMAFEVIMLAYVCRAFYQSMHESEETGQRVREFMPIMLGAVLLAIGTIAVMVPGNTFPWDTFMSVLVVFCLVYLIIRSGIIDISMTLTSGIVYGTAILLVIFPVWGSRNIVRKYAMTSYLPEDMEIVMAALLVAAYTTLVMFLARLVLHYSVIRIQDQRKEQMDEFQDEMASSLDEDVILDALCRFVSETFPVSAVRIRMRTPGTDSFKTVRDMVISRDDRDSVQKDADADEDAVFTDEEQNKLRQIDEINHVWNYDSYIHIGEIRYDKDVQGYVDLCSRKKRPFNSDEVRYFNQMCSYAGIALKNARMYKKAYEASIRDELSGAYNRSHFYEVLNSFDDNRTVSLAYMDIDNLKLYNELYGTIEGDQVIAWTSDIIKAVARGYDVFRYGSNEFAVLAPDKTARELYDVCEAVRRRVQIDSNDDNAKVHSITLSIGIAEYPSVASSRDQLVSYAARASAYGKQNGRNVVVIYSRGMEKPRDVQAAYEKIAPTVYALTAAIDAKDSYTFVHSENVSRYAVILGEALGLSDRDIVTLRQAGMLHDIGKIGIPESILKKQGRLTEEEYEIMKSHVKNSIKMIRYLPDLNYVIPAVAAHHERYDGRGYPEGMKGENIPLLGRILALADCFDAMTARRPYKPPLPVEYAVREIEKNAGTQFDPRLAQLFVWLVREGKIKVDNKDKTGTMEDAEKYWREREKKRA